MRDVKGRHDLITWGWTKLGGHTRSNTSVFKTTTVFFSRKYGLNVLPLSLQSAIYSCPRRTSPFLEAVATTWTTTTLAYNTTNHEISWHSACQVPRLMLWESTTPVYLAMYGCCSQWFLCHRSYVCTGLNHELDICGQDSVRAHAQLSRVYLTSTLDITHVIKCTRLSLTLAAGEPGNEATQYASPTTRPYTKQGTITSTIVTIHEYQFWKTTICSHNSQTMILLRGEETAIKCLFVYAMLWLLCCI